MGETLTHVKTILVFRHGARAPSKPALDAFSANNQVKEYWRLSSGELFIDALTETGKDQCRALGTWARDYLQKTHSLFDTVDPSKIKWRTSRIDRVRDSGTMFFEAFLRGENQTVNDIPYEQVDGEKPAADSYFRTWVSNENYKKWANDLTKSELFANKAKEVAPVLDQVVDKLSLMPFKKYPKPFVLYGMTFAREMVDCERYYEKEEKVIKDLLGPELGKSVDELALWCWNQRFFSDPGYRKALGEKLLAEIVEDMLDSTKQFSLYSGHDYTLLILLASIGISEYPTLLSFGSYLLFEVYDRTKADGTTERVFSLGLNPTPFEVNENPTKDVHPEHTTSIPSANGEEFWPVNYFIV